MKTYLTSSTLFELKKVYILPLRNENFYEYVQIRWAHSSLYPTFKEWKHYPNFL